MGDHVTEEEAARFALALLERGARMDVRDDILKSTPLGWACRWGRVSVAKALLERGADPVEADAEPWARPRAWAEKKGTLRHLDATQRARWVRGQPLCRESRRSVYQGRRLKSVPGAWSTRRPGRLPRPIQSSRRVTSSPTSRLRSPFRSPGRGR